MRQPRIPLTTALIALAFSCMGLVSGLFLHRFAETLPGDQLRLLRVVHKQVLESYVVEPASEELMMAAIEGLVEGLEDPHSEFVRPTEAQAFDESEIEGTYQGIGVLLMNDVAPITILTPLRGGPAESGGLRVGDRILAVDDTDVSEVTAEQAIDEAQRLLLGPAGSAARLLIERDGVEPFQAEIVRGHVPTQRTKWARLVDEERAIGYLYLTGFQRHATREVAREVEHLQQLAGGKLGALIVDLRFNRGGLLNEGIALTNLFLNVGTILELKRRGDEIVERHIADPAQCRFSDLPLVVLVNGGSASASEVFTGAVQDHGRAEVVGQRTYGKGVVQSIFRWDQLDIRLKLTTAHYYTPSGRSIEGNFRRDEDGDAEGGIPPDIEVDVDKRKLEELHYELVARNEIPRAHRGAAETLSEQLGVPWNTPLTPEQDPQLAAAVDAARALLEEGGK